MATTEAKSSAPNTKTIPAFLRFSKSHSNEIPQQKPPQARNWSKIYTSLGFKKAYNFAFFVVFAGAFLGFTLARLEYLNFNGIFCNADAPGGAGAAPGECYWYKTYRQENIGIILHLSTILPASLLAVFQFVPIIRYKAILYHRIAGYIILLLVIPSQAGVLMIAAHAFGGDNATRSFVGVLVLLTTVSLVLAYVNIKRLQIDQHRAWMLRAWALFGSIITLRLIMIISALIAAKFPGASLRIAMRCAEIAFIYKGSSAMTEERYPTCALNASLINFSANNGYAVVTADFTSDDPVSMAASFDSFFGMSGWIAIMIHVIAVELYLRLTPKETERLKQVSAERQLARKARSAGVDPGSNGEKKARDSESEVVLAAAQAAEAEKQAVKAETRL